MIQIQVVIAKMEAMVQIIVTAHQMVAVHQMATAKAIAMKQSSTIVTLILLSSLLFAATEDEVPPEPPERIFAVLNEDLGDLSQRFSFIEQQPLAAASLGQAHRAWLLPENEGSEREVSCSPGHVLSKAQARPWK